MFDIFGGFGTTIIAAELTGRRVLVVELDARYVDVIVVRWRGDDWSSCLSRLHR